MVVSFNRTIDVDCQGLPEEVLFSEAVGLLLGFFDRESDHRVAAVQACPGRVARVTFAENGDAAKLFFEELGVIKLGDVECRVVKPPPPPPQLTTVVVSWFPFEGSNDAISTALSAYGTVKSVRNQVWPGRPSVSTGSRVVQMVIRNVISPFISIRGVRCKIWYRGQPLQCTTCHKVGHKSAECPLRGKCFRCRQGGHLARNCQATVGAQPAVDTSVEMDIPSSVAQENDVTAETIAPVPNDVVAESEECDYNLEASEDRFPTCTSVDQVPSDNVSRKRAAPQTSPVSKGTVKKPATTDTTQSISVPVANKITVPPSVTSVISSKSRSEILELLSTPPGLSGDRVDLLRLTSHLQVPPGSIAFVLNPQNGPPRHVLKYTPKK